MFWTLTKSLAAFNQVTGAIFNENQLCLIVGPQYASFSN